MPYTGIVLAILALHAAVFLILLGHWLVAAGMFPQATERLAGVYGRRPLRATLLGIFTYGPLLLLLLNAAKLPNPLLRLVAIGLGFGALLLAFIGSAGLALRIGKNLTGGGSSWQHGLRGGVMLALVFITPVVGSLFLMHIGLASGFGAFLLARPWKKQPTLVPAEFTAPVVTAAPALT